MATAINYETSTHVVVAGNKEFTVRNLIPVFANEEKRNDTRQKIESDLYGIFRKYIA